jgi:glutamate-1-semialdehyde 2,1-aminomutase
MPACERIRFTSSGTEATLMALRIARIVSGRTKVVKFAGHFHGWHDFLIPAADPPHDDPRYPTPGVPEAAQGDLVVIRPNDLPLLERTLVEQQPACVIVEATGGRWGVVPLAEGFLRGLQDLAGKHGVLFVLDEVISGFRVHPGGTQGKLGLKPDLTTLAKVLAGGLPGGCVGGRADVLEAIAYDNPRGRKMKHPGTFNACPLSAAAGIETLRLVATGEPGRRAEAAASAVRVGLNELFARKSVAWAAYGESSYVKILPEYDGPRPQGDGFVPYGGAFDRLDRKWDAALGHAFRCGLLLGGVDWMGWSGMFSAAHGEDEAAQIVSAFDETIDRLRIDGLLS